MSWSTTPGTRRGSPVTEVSVTGRLLGLAVVAGLIAGAVASGFYSLAAEPVIERAIVLEEQRARAEGRPREAPLVSRPVQRVGLVVGLLLYGAVWGLVFGVAHAVVDRTVRGPGLVRRPWVLAGLLGWAVAVLPFAKYPANPPGVGDPDTIGYRQALYFGFVVLSAAGLVAAIALHRRLTSPAGPGPAGRAWIAPAAYVAYVIGLYLAMPSNPDPVHMPPNLVLTFRALSVSGLVLFWVVLAVAFAGLARARPA